jgi:tetratricopeptide (TPR) repeat protein
LASNALRFFFIVWMKFVIPEEEQQVRLWLQLAHEAYGDQQVLRALHYFHRALDYAQAKGMNGETASVCRDLGYVYARENSFDKALVCLDQGLAITETDLSIRAGLMANKASVLVRLGAYRPALELLEKSSDLIRSVHSDFSNAPGELVHSYAAMMKMADDLHKVVELLDMGVRPDRIEVNIKRYEPPWFSGEH